MPTKAEKSEYNRKRKAHLAANPWCEVALRLGLGSIPATHVHHRKGRGKYYLDESTFVSTTAQGDKWIHAHPEQAKRLGLIE